MNAPAAPGLFITFEGGEGCGKSTQVARLAARLRERVKPGRVLSLREPGGTAIGEQVRALLKSAEHNLALEPTTELLLFAASRAQLVREVIQPARRDGTLVLCDRFLDSTTVYQGVARHLDPETVRLVNAVAVDGCRPDATVLLDLPVSAARERLRERASMQPSLLGDAFDAEPDTFFERVRAGYHALAAAEPARVLVIDADQPAEEVERAVRHALLARFPERYGLFA